MNYFLLDKDINQSVKYHLDSHCGKILTENVQILSSNYRLSGVNESCLFKTSHINHPVTKWARESYSNFQWMVLYAMSLHEEYLFRYNKPANYLREQQILAFCFAQPIQLPDLGITPFALAIPDDCKTADPVTSYRNYYNKHKRHLFYKKDKAPRWTNREIPNWIEL